jgi:WS/DGAT/MGAT family acyltransferase
MSSVDTAWLRMDRPNNLMMIVGVMMFDGRIDGERLKRTVEARLLPYRRFRQRVVYDAAGTAHWRDDEDFDLDAHVRRIGLPGAGGKAELQQAVAELVSTPLDPNRPLWQYQLVESYDGGSALIVRIHHCIADGIALIGVLLSLTDQSADAASPPPPSHAHDAEDGADPFWRQMFQPMTDAMLGAVKLSGTIWSKYWSAVFNPQQVLDYARLSGSIAGETAQLALMPDDTPTRYKGVPGKVKRAAWSEPMPLAEVKAVCKQLGCSVNDVLLSSVAGALRSYLYEHGDAVDDVELRALVPVNLRTPDQEEKLGNRFGLVALVLPVGIEHPYTRLYEVKKRMEALKGSHQAAVTLGILTVVGMLPKAVQEQVLDMLARKATAVMTNVPGPQQQLYLAGARLTQQMFWVPQSGDIGMGVSILSYNGQVQFGLMTDRKFVPDPENIVSRFAPEFDKLLLAATMEASGETQDAKPAARAARAARAGAATPRTKPRSPARAAHGGAAVEPAAAAAQVPPAPGKPRVPKRFR